MTARRAAVWIATTQVLVAIPVRADCPTALPGLPNVGKWVREERLVLEQKLGWTLKVPVCLAREGIDPAKPDRPGRASYWDVSGRRWPDGCWLTIFDPGAALVEEELRSVVVHEIYHCFQDEWLDDFAAWQKMPTWLTEGSARWVGEVLHPTSTLGVDLEWKEWFSRPAKPLFTRGFDAVGFYGHLQDSAGPAAVWAALRPAVVAAKAGGSPAAYGALLGVQRQKAVGSWAASYFRDAAFGDAWTALGPGQLPPRAPIVTPLKLGAGDSADLAADPYTVADARLFSTAEVVTVVARGALRVGAAGGLDRALDGGELALCTASDGCACPSGATWRGPELVAAPNGAGDEPPRFALTGDAAGAALHVEAHRLEDFCEPAATAIGCALLAPADFAAAGVPGAGPPVDHGGGGEHYCVYAGKSGATGGIELDVFLNPGARDAEITWGVARAELTPNSTGAARLPGIDRGELLASPRDFSWLLVRKARLVFVLSIPGGPGVEEQLLRLGRLVLERAKPAL